ncbi:MAG: nucleoside phosphorylase [Flavobacteriales bacterium]|nr:nucleoside phosphorylase [Flavobacteriales bacterium]
MRRIEESELIITPEGQIYHIHIRPEELADDVILVGDPARVPVVSKYFDRIDLKSQNREMVVHTGEYCGKRVTVLSTGMGPDNIDIVINELDALKNIDFATRTVNEDKKSLNIVRMGTSGALQAEIPVDSYVLSRRGIGFDGVLHFYQSDAIREKDIEDAFIEQTHWNPLVARPYVVGCGEKLYKKLSSERTVEGFTGTAVGFYGPQGRVLRLPLATPDANARLEAFSYKGIRMTNFEMETSAIYGLSKLLGHQACSLNCIVANRLVGTFSKDPYKAVEGMIQYALDKLIDKK